MNIARSLFQFKSDWRNFYGNFRSRLAMAVECSAITVKNNATWNWRSNSHLFRDKLLPERNRVEVKVEKTPHRGERELFSIRLKKCNHNQRTTRTAQTSYRMHTYTIVTS